MNCERCGKAPGEIRYSEYAGGQVHKTLVCPACARELGFVPAKSPPEASGAPANAGATAAGGSDAADAPADRRVCPGCGLTAEEFRRVSLFGCDHCFETFEDDLDLLLKRLHGASLHRGRLPRAERGPEAPAERGRLERELEDALRSGDFERAARLRERIRRAGREDAP